MTHVDVFNGDADGICALAQVRNADPRPSRLVTGVKRDIALVAKAGLTAGDEATVLDISFDKNRDAVVAALEAGASIFYCDHHFAGEIPDHPRLTTRIDTAAEVCTSLLVDQHLGGKFSAWAVTGAYGDNLDRSAEALADRIGLDGSERATLRRLGVCINYNGYGSSLDDLLFAPADLFERVRPFADPRTFVREDREAFERLTLGYDEDMAKAQATEPLRVADSGAVFALPDESWARRVSGVWSNDLANASPDRAHAVLTARPDGTWLVSVRAPLNRRSGADALCRRYPTGGGRAAAAGINALPSDLLDGFVEDFLGSFAAAE
jgi:hypothetical protein